VILESALSPESRSKAFIGGTLIDGTGRPPIQDSVVVIEGERIVAVGERGQVEVPEGTEIIDTTDMTVIPGLIDAHLHFLWMGMKMIRTVDLSPTKSIKEAQNEIMVKLSQTKKGEWILGRGWDDSKWEEKRFISKWDLDPFSRDHPIVLTRVCGHMITLNSKAMEIAGITKDTPDPPGGKVNMSPDGDPTGVLSDAGHLIKPFIPPETKELALEGLKLSNEKALSLGCTGVHDAGLDESEIIAYQTALEEGILKARVNIMWRSNLVESIGTIGCQSSFRNEMLRLGPAKIILDGSLGARTAALYEPYEDDPSTKGLTLITEEELNEQVQRIHGQGFQLAIHAIGDYGIDLVINAIEAALKSSPRKDHRHRIEHCELLSSDQIERIHTLGIIASMQPNFVGEWSGPDSLYEARLGKRRLRQNNPFRALLDEGIRLPFGSDGMPFHPLYGIHSAVNHYIRDSRISLEEAVKCFTLDAAYSSFEEEKKGSVESGKLADITVLEKDLVEVPSEEIKDVLVYMTIVNGELLYSKD
jgi:predicted amidohydrolase YtcJ